jgi:hypothetical protein
MTKYLSVNYHIHQDVSTGKLDEAKPIVSLLTPANPEATTFGEPTESALHNPTTGGELGFARDGASFNHGFTALTPVLDMDDVVFSFDKLMNVGVIVAFVHANMLFNLTPIRSRNDHGNDQFIRQPFVMDIRSGNVNGQRRSPLVNQQVQFAPALAAVDWAFSGRFSAKRCWAAFAIQRLKQPSNILSSRIETRHQRHQLEKQSAALPVLKPLMQHAATHAKPIPMHCFPLAACPQHIPNPIHDRPVICWRSAAPGSRFRLRQQPPKTTPQRTWDTEVIDIFRFLGMLVVHGVFALIGVW